VRFSVLRIGRLLAACVSAAVLLVACPHDDTRSGPARAGRDLQLSLSPAERAYLESLPPLRLGVDPIWAPMAFVNQQGRIDGISADYLNFLRQTLGIHFRLVPTRSWGETIQFANEGRIDIVVAASPFDELSPAFGLSAPYVRYPLVIVTRETAPFIGSLEDLEGGQVAIVGDVQTARVRFPGLPHVHLVTVASAAEGLKTVAQGRAFAYIGNLGVVDRIVRERYAGTLRVAAPADRIQSLSFAVAPRFAPLLPLIDRVLAGIPEAEREQIQNSWLSTRFAFGVAPRTLWLVLAPVGGLTLIFLALLSLNMLRLRKEVRHRRRTERELLFETRFKALLMDTVPIPVCVKDAQGHYVAVNPAYEQAMGVRAESLIGKALPPPGPGREVDVDVFAQAARAVIETGRPAQGELRYRGPDGTTHEAVYWVRLCSSEDDDRAAVLCAFVDVSDLRRMERRELEHKRRLVELTQALPSVVFQLRLVRSEARPRFELVFANRRADALLGSHESRVADAFGPFLQTLDRPQRRRLTKMFLRSARSLERVRAEFMLALPGRERAWFHVEAEPRAREDGCVEWSGYLHDVTEAKASQAALICAKHEAENAARARDAFIATVSHEIRTPMSGIISILQLLDHDGLTADDRHLVEMASNAAELLLRILNDILDFAKSENGELSLEAAPMSIAEIAERCAGFVAPEITRKGLRLHVEIAPAVAPRHLGDSQRLGQVLLNLLGNAVKFTDRGSVSLTVEVIGESATQQTLSVRIADTGIGISAEDQARLFSPFSQARGTLANGYGGTGLGLAICRGLIERMGGSIALQSELGHGTTIVLTLTLPVDPDAPAERGDDEAVAAGGEGALTPPRRILLVEDHAINREVLRRQLAALKIVDCDLAVDGAQALSAYAQGNYAMVITDCAMPVLDGVVLMRSIRQRERALGRHTVLVALTADATPGQREICLDAGADEVFVKPLSLEQLQLLLARYRLLDPPSAGSSGGSAPDDLWPQVARALAADMDTLLACAAAGDGERIRDVAHQIAGMAAWFQLTEVAQAAADVEQGAGKPDGTQASVLALKAAIERALAPAPS
jgi:PAS domain S-box-containing protein